MSTESKVCTKCRIEQPVENFWKDSGSKDGLKHQCKSCRNLVKREYRSNPLVRKKEYLTKKRRKKTWRWEIIWQKYRLTEKDYNEMLESQKGLCALCESRPPKHIDHCHASGKVRGLLCVQCNTGLGKFKDSEDLLTKAVGYLQKFKALEKEYG